MMESAYAIATPPGGPTLPSDEIGTGLNSPEGSCDNLDALWMTEVAEGDMDAFRRIVEKYQQSMLNLGYRFTGDNDASKDIAQEIFLKIYTSASRYRPEAKFSTWLYRVAVNHCLNQVRDRSRGDRHTGTLRRTVSQGEGCDQSAVAPQSQSPEEVLLEQEKAARVREAIRNLPARQRMAVVLHRYHGFRYAEIAQAMECSVGAVESLLSRATDQLRRSLADVHEGKESPP